jgi:hypothetical protein
LKYRRAAAAICACRGKDAPPSPAPAAQPEAPAAASPSTPGPRPELAAPDEAGIAPATPGDRFAAEAVDRSWKARTEGDLRKRLPRVSQIECHTSMCQLVAQGTQAELATAMRDLEKLQDSAHHVVLSQPEPGSGDRLTLRAYLRFERSDLNSGD